MSGSHAEQCRELADTIREGCLRAAPCRGWMTDNHACALGAAWLVITDRPVARRSYCETERFPVDLLKKFPVLNLSVPVPKNCALNSKQDMMLMSVITYLNDGPTWAREKIADYVESLADCHFGG